MRSAAVMLSIVCCFGWPAVSSYDIVPMLPAACGAMSHSRPLRLRGGDGAVVPGVAWSQQADSLLLKVDMPPGKHSTEGLQLSNTHATWKEASVDLDIAFFGSVDSKAAKIFSDGGRQIKINVPKLESSWWPRLTSGPKPFNVKIDWASWKDENEAETRKYSAGAKFKDDDFNYDDAAGKDDPSPWAGNDDKDDDGDGDLGGMDDAELHKAVAENAAAGGAEDKDPATDAEPAGGGDAATDGMVDA